jgi:hypothetical protein
MRLMKISTDICTCDQGILLIGIQTTHHIFGHIRKSGYKKTPGNECIHCESPGDASLAAFDSDLVALLGV